MDKSLKFEPIADSPLGAVLTPSYELSSIINYIRDHPKFLLNSLNKFEGLLLIKNLSEINDHPEILVELSEYCGDEVENYWDTPTPRNMIHSDQQQILVISNLPPCDRQPPAQPNPATNDDGSLPVQFPHRTGWHTDQSFRRPPPDISLFYAEKAAPRDQGQTIFANGYKAYEQLSSNIKEQIKNLNGLHALLGTGRTAQAVKDGIIPMELQDHQKSQLQPLVRIHPVTKRPALYLCEYGQMDWLDGPIAGMETGPNGKGAELLSLLMTHYTQPKFTYVHEWDDGDLVIYDNRCLIHTATWFDADNHNRSMWRTTVFGNPGPEYAGEDKSWIPKPGEDHLQGLGDGRWDNLTRT